MRVSASTLSIGSGEIERGGHQVASHVPEHAQARLAPQRAPRAGLGRIGHVVLVEYPAKVDDAADAPPLQSTPSRGARPDS